MDSYKKLLLSMLMLISMAYAHKGTRAMQDVIFREYDIRGKVGTELIVQEVYDLTRAIAWYIKQQQPKAKKVAVGMDGRTHSQEIKEQVVKGLVDSGLDAVFIGMCPTPVLYFALHTQSFDAGIMITASHNPKEYNGMKLCLGHESVWGTNIQHIKQIFNDHLYLNPSKKGSYSEHVMLEAYIKWMVETFKHLKRMKLSAVIDCGNGAAGTVMPEIVRRMGWAHVMLLYADVDGTYPNHEADPTVAHNMVDVKNVLARTNIDVGLGLDGDCDRMDPMTKSGFLVPGDQLLGLFSQQLIQDHPGAAVVFDVKSSSGLIELLNTIGAKPCMSPSGHSIIKDQMKKNGALLGGELSCHFFFNDRYFGYDDGIYAMMRLFEILIASGKTLDQELAIFPKKFSSPEYRIQCQEGQKQTIVKAVKEVLTQRPDVQANTIDGIRATMPYGWGLVRVSNTQPALTIRFESDTHVGLQRVKQDFYDALQPFFDASWLQHQLGL